MIWKQLFGRKKSMLRNPLDSSQQTPGLGASSLDLTELEDRILMSATPMAPDAMPEADLDESLEVDAQLDEAPHADLFPGSGSPGDSDGEPLSESAVLVEETIENADATTRREVVFVDTTMDGYEELLQHLIDSQDESTELEIFELDSNGDGVKQISDVLEQFKQLDAVHIVSHGNEGSLRLGDIWLNADQLHAYAGDIAQWNGAFASDGDLLLYGCNLAATSEGQAFLDSLHVLTGADVTASTDLTGHTVLGGDWDLEFSIGIIETDELLSLQSQQQWAFVLPTEFVYDGFETHDYSGSYGSVDWTGSWVEVGDDGDDDNGDVSIAHYDLDAIGFHSLEIRAAANTGIYREVDLSGASSAELSFDYQRHDSNGFLGSTLEIQVSDNGGSDWHTIHTINAGIDASPQGLQLDLTDYMAPDTQIRFMSTAAGTGSIFLDHIDITYTTNVAPVIQSGGALTLSSIQEDEFNNSGNTVAEVIASAGGDRIIDGNTGASEGIAVIDVDDSDGTWQYDAQADGNWQAFGTVSNNSAVLLGTTSKIRFVPDPDFNGSGGQIEFRAWDQTSGDIGDTGVDVSGSGGSQPFSTGTDTASIDVAAVNDQPLLTLPGNQSVNEDTSLAIAGISISDVDAGTGDLEVTLAVNDGTLTLGTATNLTFSDGDGSDDATMTFTGTLTDINTALATLSYQGDLDFSGTDTLSVSVDDQNNTGSGPALQDAGTLDIDVAAVNDQPLLTLPGNQSVNEDTSLAIAGISISDVDAGTGDLEVTLAVNDGTLTLGTATNLAFSDGDGSDDATMTFTGTLTDINTALATLSYQGDLDFSGTDTLSVSVDDQNNTGSGPALQDAGTLDIDVAAVNDQPLLTLPGNQSVNEDTSLAIAGISISDVDAGTGDLEVTLAVNDGTLTLGTATNLTFSDGDGSDDATMTFTGTLTDINTALATLSYQGDLDFSGTDTLSVSVDDQNNTGSGPALQDAGTLDIDVAAVNDQPLLTLPGNQSVNEDTSLAIAGISISDVDAGTGDLEVTLAVNDGTLTLGTATNLTFSDGDGSDDATMTFTGTLTDINTALATLSYQGDLDFSGTDTLSVSVDDQNNTGSGPALQDAGTLDIDVAAVNDQPLLTLPGNQSVNEDTSLAIAGISISDVDAGTGDLEVTLAINDGTLTLGTATNLTFSDGDGSDDATMTFTGTLTDINTALATLSYQGDPDFSGTDTLSVSVDDQNNTGSGPALQDAGTLDIDVAAVNDQPLLTLPGNQSVNEDTSLAIAGISISDVDAGTGDLEVTLAVNDGTLTLGTATNLTFSDGDGSDDATMTFTGTLTDINTALATLSYQGDPDFSGTDTLSVSVDDQNNTGSGPALQDAGTLDIDVAAVNDQPLLTLPGNQSVNEDTSLAIAGISISDVDAGTGDLEVTLAVNDGTLTLGTATNLAFSDGDGSDDATMTFTGTLTDINTALATLSYQGDLDFSGTDTLSVSVDDQNNTGSGPALQDAGTLDIDVAAVNDQPLLTLPGNQSVNEDTSLAIAGISISDVDAGTGDLEVTLAVNDGTLTLGTATNLTFSDGDGSDDATMTFTGTLTDINTALATLSYQGDPDFSGTDTLSVSVDDQNNTGSGPALQDAGTLDIDVAAVNDQPLLTLPGNQSVNEDTSLAIAGISISDVDAGTGDLEVTLAVNDGTLTLGTATNLTFSDGDGSDDATMTFTGTLTDINTALATLSYQGDLDFSGTDTLSVSVDDQNNTGSGPALQDAGTLDIDVAAVNDQPLLTLPGNQSVNEDTSLAIAGISISDVDAGTGDLEVTLAVNDGTLTLGTATNLTFSDGDGSDDATMTFTGTLTDINTALATLSYQGDLDFSGTDTLSVSVDDQNNTGSGPALQDAGTLDIDVAAVNDQPLLTLPGNQSVNEDTSLAIAGISISDVDAGTGDLEVTLAVNDGTLTLGTATNLTFSDGDGSDDATMTFTGTLTDINTALATLSYQGDPDFSGTDTLSVSVDDQNNTGSGPALQDAGTLDIDVAAVNDQPLLTLPGNQSVNEDTSLAIAGISISDVDAGTGDLEVTLAVNDGTLTLGTATNLAFSDGDGSDDATMTFTGTLTDINTALATLSYQGDPDFSGTDTLSVSVDDQNNTGSGPALQDAGTLDIDVAAVNDQPLLTLPGNQSVNEDTSLAIAGISISDVDAGTGDLEVTLAVNDGTLTLGTATNLAFSDGDGSDDATMTFTGTLTDINTALATLSYQGDLDFSGTDTLSVSVDDQNNTGSGPALQDAGTLDIDVLDLNDRPTSVGIADISVKEDTVFSVVDLYAAFDDAEDPDSQLTYSIVDITSPELFENAFINPTGKLVLRYVPDMHGTSDITIKAEDTQGLSITETFEVEVTPVNDAPVASQDIYSVRGDEVLNVTPSGILTNDSDVDGDELIAALVRQPHHGKLVLNPDGSFRYVPDPSFVGIDSFAYVASDGDSVSERVRVFIKVLVPSSPIDTDPGDSGGGDSSDNSTDPSSDNQSEHLSALVNAELPSGITNAETDDDTVNRHRSGLDEDGGMGIDDINQPLSAELDLVGSGVLSDMRSTSRSRYVDDVQDYLGAPIEINATSSELALPELDSTTLFGDLEDLDIMLDEEGTLHRLMIGSAVGLTTGLTVGYVFWTVRAGYLLTTLIAQMPAWRLVDPLPILNSLDSGSMNMDGESLESIVQSDLAGHTV